MKKEAPQKLSYTETDEMRHRVEGFDWGKTSLGDRKKWSPVLQAVVNLCLDSRLPMLIMWSTDLVKIYNDEYRTIIGEKHPDALGEKAQDVWQDLWPEIGPMLRDVYEHGKSVKLENHPFTLLRNGYPEQCYFTFSYSPIRTHDKIEGILVSVIETTDTVLHEEHSRTLRNQQLATLFSQAPVAMCILKDAEFIVEVVNGMMLQIWDKTTNEVIGRPVFEAMPEVRFQGFEQLLTKVYSTGEKEIIPEAPLTIKRNGRLENIFVKLVFEALKESDGTSSGVMVIADEITEHILQRNKIIDSEERLRMAMQSTRMGTWDFNPISGELNWSEACRNILGARPDEPIDFQMFTECIYPEERAFVLAEIEKAMDANGDGNYDITFRIVRFSDNGMRWIRSQGKVFFNAQRQAERFIGNVIDITEQRVFEEHLQDSEQRARFTIEASGIGTFEWNMIDGAFIFSDRLAKVFGFENTDGIGHTDLISRIHPEDATIRVRAHEQAGITGKLFYEARVIWPDNSIHWIRLNGQITHYENGIPSRMYGTTTDITEERTQAERLEVLVEKRSESLKQRNLELKESEERYHKMIEEVQDYAIILLSPSGVILNWNRGAENIKQYNESEIVGKNFRIFYLPEDQHRKVPETLLETAVREGKARHEGWRVRKDGSQFWGSITITALHDDKNNIIGFSKVTRDLTDKKLAEDKLLEYTTELEYQNKELEQFAYVASHDLQEPLRKIQTFSEMVRRNLKDEAAVTKYFGKIDSSARRMTDLIRAVLNYSRLSRDNEEIREVDLNAIVESVKQDFELLIEEKKAAIMNEPLPTIKGSPLQINQLFSNLIGNALKFTENDPCIIITSKVVSGDQVRQHEGVLAKNNYLEIAVKDNGIGFEQQYEKQIFTIFQRLHGKQQYSGTGIGLALCKKIMDNHHGYISAESETGLGATFYVYFPNEQK